MTKVRENLSREKFKKRNNCYILLIIGSAEVGRRKGKPWLWFATISFCSKKSSIKKLSARCVLNIDNMRWSFFSFSLLQLTRSTDCPCLFSNCAVNGLDYRSKLLQLRYLFLGHSYQKFQSKQHKFVSFNQQRFKIIELFLLKPYLPSIVSFYSYIVRQVCSVFNFRRIRKLLNSTFFVYEIV